MRSVALLGLLAVLAPAQTEIDRSTDRKAEFGKHLAQEILRRFAEIPSGPAVESLQRIGSRLGQVADPPRELRLRLVHGSSNFLQEPWAFPGGIIIVPIKLYETAATEDEFAGMIAHAIAHIEDEQQYFRRASRTEITNWASIPLIYIGGWVGAGGDSMVPAQLVEKAQAFEAQADARAVQLLGRAGFDPGALAAYLRRASEGRTLTRYSREPSLDQRLAAATPAPAAAEADDAAFQAAKQHAAEITGTARVRRNPPSLRRDKR